MYAQLFKTFRKFGWLLPGFLLWAAFPPMGEKTDVLFALAPLLWLSRRALPRTSAKRWFLSGAFYWVATLSWMPAIVKNGGPWPLVVLGWFALAAYCAAYFALFGYLSATYWTWVRQGRGYGWRLLGVLAVEPILWSGLELVRSRFLGGFAWNQLGVVAANGGFATPAALGGVYLLSAVIVLINGTVAGIAERVWRPEKSGFPRLKRLGSLETLLAFGLIWGVYALADILVTHEECPNAQNVRVGMVQRNFPCVFKGREQNAYELYGLLTDNFSAHAPELVVLSESAMCEFGPVDQQGAEGAARWISDHCGGAAVLAGGTRYGDGTEFNSAALYAFSSNRTERAEVQLYDKVHLVPFGEFIPGDKWITALQKLAPVGSCTAGELKTLTLRRKDGDVPFGVAICFEDTDSAQIRELAKKGAKLLVFITNDSWFSHSAETVQHAWQATARAVETGLSVVRTGNSGVTGTISPNGKCTWLIGPDGRPMVDRRGTMMDRIVLGNASPTPYVIFGDIPLFLLFLLLICTLILIQYCPHHE